MKFPSTLDGGTAPSGSSVAAGNPGVCGSRVGGAGRVACAVGADAGDLDGAADCAAADAAHASKIMQDAKPETIRNVHSLFVGADFTAISSPSHRTMLSV
jgi:hypothetical protein